VFKDETCFTVPDHDLPDRALVVTPSNQTTTATNEDQVTMQMNNQIAKAVQKAEAKLNLNKALKHKAQQWQKGNNDVPVCFVNDEQTEDNLLLESVKQAHREKINTAPLNFMSAVVKVLGKKDPLWHSQGAKDALMKESNKLISAGVWDMKPMEKDEVIKQFPEATFSALFEILGLKNSELADAIYKARIVVQGSSVTNTQGDYIYFADTTSSPTNMCAIRSLVAYGEVSGGGSSQADAEAAYIQPRLPEDIRFYVRIPQTLMTDEMKQSVKGMFNPVFRLRRPLYGWSRSGNIWEKRLAETLQSLDEATEQNMAEF
jgi:hypothetical protein